MNGLTPIPFSTATYTGIMLMRPTRSLMEAVGAKRARSITSMRLFGLALTR